MLLLTAGCSQQTASTEKLFQLLSSEQTGIHFTNQAIPNDSMSIFDFNYFYNGGGVAVGDVSGDGLPDIYFTGNMTSSRLYLNRGGMRFEEVTETAKVGTRNWATGVSMVDINQDGRLDLYVCFSAYKTAGKRANQLFINQGNDPKGIPVFREMAHPYGLDDTGYSSQAAFFDYDRDGDLDVYLATVDRNNQNPNLPHPKISDGSSPSNDRLYRNNGTGTEGHPTFSNVAKAAGIVHEGFGLAVSVSDLNGDGWPDIYVSNDFIFNDLLYINNRNGTFTESAAQCLKHQSLFAMGNDVADINNDGLPDILVLDMLPDDNQRQKLMNTAMNYDRFQLALEQGYQPQYSRNTLQLNRGTRPDGRPMFSEIGYLSGIYQTDWSWSALLADFDNDGYRDLFVSNGIPKDITDSDFIVYRDTKVRSGSTDSRGIKKTLTDMLKELPAVKKPDFLFQNKGNLTFTDQSAAWGMELPACSNGAAYADLDNDGDLDLVINNLDEEASLFRNNASQQLKRHFLRVRLAGAPANRNGFGAKVTVRNGGKIQVSEQSSCRGFQSSVEPVLHFGLGQDSLVEALEVTWPDGKSQSLTNIKASQVVTLDYREATEKAVAKTSLNSPIFTEESEKRRIQFQHRENPFIDFKFEPLLPQKYSQNGPGLAVGDVNGDGLDDFFVGGPSKIPGRFFLQDQQGNFREREFVDPGYEDQGVLLFDADNDGDLDLYVVSGGNEYNAYQATYQDRLYRNEGADRDGNPNFRRDAAALPAINASGSCVTAADYDQDGDLDLFVGGRIVPGKYPLPAKSYILRNDSGRFSDVTASVCPALSAAGLVTAALWSDFDSDGKMDLIIASEWEPIRLFRNEDGRLVNETGISNLANARGWWNSLTAGDFDNDGDMDYIAGNLGLNTRYKASAEEPVRVFAKDFDGNGSLDALFSYYIRGKPYLAHSRDALTEQIVSWRKRFPRYADYANASLSDILGESELKDVYSLQATYLQSSYLENLGKGRFRLQPLPVEAQFAPVFGTQVLDVDSDGNLDVLLTGNSHATEFVAGWYDASFGQVLKGNGKGGFAPLSWQQTNFVVDGDAKSLAQLTTSDNHSLLLAGVNSGPLKALVLARKPTYLLRLLPTDAWADITLENGKKRRQEFYYGSGYLSQSSRSFEVSLGAQSVDVYDFSGKSRRVGFLQANVAK